MLRKHCVAVVAVLSLGCGGHKKAAKPAPSATGDGGAAQAGKDANSQAAAALPPLGVPDAAGVVVKSRGLLVVSSDGTAIPELTASGSVPVTVTNAAATVMTVDAKAFVVPANPANALADFGFLNVASLADNSLDVCGAAGKTHCGTAVIRIYTTGVGGAGFYNATGGYGAPMTAGLAAAPLGNVGLNVAGALVLQSATIAATKHTVKLADFTPTPHYDVKGDFTNAGAGSYSTTIVVEYALTP